MKDRIFVDTNLWVYAKIESKDLQKHEMAQNIFLEQKHPLYISTQIINELFNVLSKNKINDVVIIEAIHQILQNVVLIDVTLNTIEESWKIRKKYHYSVYDCLVLASALEAKCTILYTEDLQHNQLIENRLRIINPFLT